MSRPHLAGMTDTLFDLDALAPSVAPKADVEDVRLANQIASSATLATKAASDAIGLWGRSRAVAVDDPVLGGEFVDTVNSDRWRVANVGLSRTATLSCALSPPTLDSMLMFSLRPDGLGWRTG